jgi:hypothetical protein
VGCPTTYQHRIDNPIIIIRFWAVSRYGMIVIFIQTYSVRLLSDWWFVAEAIRDCRVNEQAYFPAILAGPPHHLFPLEMVNAR